MAVAKKLKKDESLQQELARHMAEKCEGMFLWIKLQQEQLRGGIVTKCTARSRGFSTRFDGHRRPSLTIKTAPPVEDANS
jgi:hypothetical protein